MTTALMTTLLDKTNWENLAFGRNALVGMNHKLYSVRDENGNVVEPGLDAVCNIVDGQPGDRNACVLLDDLDMPSEVTDRIVDPSAYRKHDAILSTKAYSSYMNKLVLSRAEAARYLSSGNWQKLIDQALGKATGRVIAAFVDFVKNADGTSTIPDLSGSTDALASTHSLLNGLTYTNFTASALTNATLMAGYSTLASEYDWTGAPVYDSVPAFIVGGESANIVSLCNTTVDSNNVATVGTALKPLHIAGLGSDAFLSAGAKEGGITIEFAHNGRPWVKVPTELPDGRLEIYYGCEFAILAGDYRSAFFFLP